MEPYENDDPSRTLAVSFREYWTIVLKRKWTIISFALTVFILAALFSFLAKPVYTAQGTLLIERESNILSFGQGLQIESFNDEYVQTRFKLLESRALADETINRMKLYENPGFAGINPSKEPVDAKSNPLFRDRLFKVFSSRLAVKPIPQTSLVEVKFKDGDPKSAAVILNTFFDVFIDMSVKKKSQTSEQASESLTEQINTIRAEIETSEITLQQYGVDKNIITLNDRESTVIGKLSSLNKAMNEAQIEVIQKESYYNEVKTATPDDIPAAFNNIPLIQRLREDYARMNRDYSKNQETFLPEYPEMKRLKAELETAKAALENETKALIRNAYTDYQAASRQYRSLQEAFNDQKLEASRFNSNAVQYNSLKIEIDNKKSLLEQLSRRQNETGVSARLQKLQASNISIVDKAEVPVFPSSPNKKMNMIMALLVGLIGGFGLAFLFERLDNSVKNADDVKKYAGLSSLGIVPSFSMRGLKKAYGHSSGPDPGKKTGTGKGDPKATGSKKGPEVQDELPAFELIAYLAPNSTFAEHYRSIRTTLLLTAPESPLRTMVITSAFPKEGKSSTLSNLAVSLTQAGKRVLIIDADMRNPCQHKIFQIENATGLSNYLAGGKTLGSVLHATSIPQLFMINAGPVPLNPMELLGSGKMSNLLDESRSNFDFILIDSPPVLAVSDALVLGPKIDGMILVVWGEKTSRLALRMTRVKLDAHRINGVGVIINKARLRDNDYYYTHRYYA
jgi:polysaccharide biosynthesis transport protein